MALDPLAPEPRPLPSRSLREASRHPCSRTARPSGAGAGSRPDLWIGIQFRERREYARVRARPMGGGAADSPMPRRPSCSSRWRTGATHRLGETTILRIPACGKFEGHPRAANVDDGIRIASGGSVEQHPAGRFRHRDLDIERRRVRLRPGRNERPGDRAGPGPGIDSNDDRHAFELAVTPQGMCESEGTGRPMRNLGSARRWLDAEPEGDRLRRGRHPAPDMKPGLGAQIAGSGFGFGSGSGRTRHNDDLDVEERLRERRPDAIASDPAGREPGQLLERPCEHRCGNNPAKRGDEQGPSSNAYKGAGHNRSHAKTTGHDSEQRLRARIGVKAIRTRALCGDKPCCGYQGR